MTAPREIAGRALALLLVSVPAFAIALLCTLFIWTYSGPQYDVVILNDHQLGGTFDKVVALIVGTVSGRLGSSAS